jgi:hypothetical protein
MTAPQLKVQIQGQGVVSADNLNSYLSSCNTFADLRAFIGVPGIEVFSRGRSAINDGFGGLFYWDASGLGPDDNATLIVPSGTTVGCWVRSLFSQSLSFFADVASIAALRAIPPVTGSIYYVSGYSTEGDGGEGFFLCTSVNPGADNGGTILHSNTPNVYYVRQFVGPFSVKWFGAKGDGVTDDAPAINATFDAAYAANFSGVFFPSVAVKYGIKSKINFKASFGGSDQNGVIIAAISGFSGTYMLDFNGAAAGQARQIDNVIFDVRALGTGTSVKVTGSSSAGAGGSNFLLTATNVRMLSASTSQAPLAMTSSTAEPGALTFSNWVNLAISAPRCISIGNNQDNILFVNGEFDNGAGGSSVPVEMFSGAGNVSFLNCGFEFVDASQAFFHIGSGQAIFDNCFLESTANIANTPWGFLCNQNGTSGVPETRLTIRNLTLNVAYTGASADQALVRVNINDTAAPNYTQYIEIDGVFKSSGGNTPWDTVFNLSSASGSATGPVTLTINNVDEFAKLSKSATGSSSSGANVKAHLQGWWRGTVLNHTAPAPAAGSAYTWTWQLPAASFSA